MNPSIKLQNNTDQVLPVTLFQTFSESTSINARTQYQWNITSETFVGNTVNLLYRRDVDRVYSVLSAPLQNQTLSGLLQVLNQFNVGSFWTTSSGGNTYIVTYNDGFIFDTLSVASGQSLDLAFYLTSQVPGAADGFVNVSFDFVSVVLENFISNPDFTFQSPIVAGTVVAYTVFGPSNENVRVQRFVQSITPPYNTTVVYDEIATNTISRGEFYIEDGTGNSYILITLA